MNKINYIIYFLILIFFFGIRFYFLVIGTLGEFEEKTIENCMIAEIEENNENWEIKCDDLIIYTEKNDLEIGDKLELFGRVKVRVTNRVLVEKILINPDISVVRKFTDFKVEEQWFYHPVVSIKRLSFGYRNRLLQSFQENFSSKESALLSGIILGRKELFSDDFYEELRRSGLVHLVVASGGNIALLVSILSLMLKGRVSRTNSFILSYIFILFYLFLVGFEPPLVRASIMFFLVSITKIRGLKSSSIYILAETALIMLIINPELIFSLSFILSFGATLGIILFGSDLQEKMGEIANKKGLKFLDIAAADVSQTLSAQLLVIPPLLISMGEFNFLGIFSNILVGFLIAPISYLGITFLCLIESDVRFLGQLIVFVLKPMLSWMVVVSESFAEIELGRYYGNLSWIGIGFWIGFLVWLKKKLRRE